jgi:crossover junction endodeoxyribonuclease RusA
MIELDLPYPPSVNRYWRHNRGRTHLSKEGRDYQKHVSTARARGGIETISGPVEVTINVNPPDRRRRDVDNLLKGIGDGLQKGGVLVDDSQIKKLTIEMHEPVRGGRCHVSIVPRTQAA